MMREILFRGKRVDNGEWVEGYYKLCGHLVGTIEEDIFTTITPFNKYGYIVDPKTVGQFTGLTDKNGKKIFEGDIVKAKASHPCGGDVIGTVVVSLDDYELMWDLDHSHEIEVIGNIHDKPELVEGVDMNGSA